MKILTISTILSGAVIAVLVIPIAATLVGLTNFWFANEFDKREVAHSSYQIKNKVSLPGTSLKLLKKSDVRNSDISSYELEFPALKVSPKISKQDTINIFHLSDITEVPESNFTVSHANLENTGNILIKIKNKRTLNYVLIAFTLVTLALCTVYGYGLLLLSRLYKNVSKAEIFSRVNKKILIKLALIAFGIFLWDLGFDYHLRNQIMDSFAPSSGFYTYTIDLSLGGLLAGSVFLLMAGIVAKGYELKSENDLTI